MLFPFPHLILATPALRISLIQIGLAFSSPLDTERAVPSLSVSSPLSLSFLRFTRISLLSLQ